MFAPGYYGRAAQLKFLREFVPIISRPVQPHETHEEKSVDDGPLTMDRIFQDIIAEAHDDDEDDPIEPSRQPSLRYVKNSARIIRVTGMKVDYEYAWD